MVIRAIVYAQNEQDGLSKAKYVFDRLCERAVFDYYATFDEDNGPVAGKGRWGELPVVASAESKEGKELIEEGMRFTKKDFMQRLKVVREVLASKSDEEVFESEYDKEMVRHQFYCLGEYQGSSTWLYDNDGEGIRTEEFLEKVLNKWEDERFKDLKVYVVPADVHF